MKRKRWKKKITFYLFKKNFDLVSTLMQHNRLSNSAKPFCTFHMYVVQFCIRHAEKGIAAFFLLLESCPGYEIRVLVANECYLFEMIYKSKRETFFTDKTNYKWIENSFFLFIFNFKEERITCYSAQPFSSICFIKYVEIKIACVIIGSITYFVQQTDNHLNHSGSFTNFSIAIEEPKSFSANPKRSLTCQARMFLLNSIHVLLLKYVAGLCAYQYIIDSYSIQDFVVSILLNLLLQIYSSKYVI